MDAAGLPTVAEGTGCHCTEPIGIDWLNAGRAHGELELAASRAQYTLL